MASPVYMSAEKNSSDQDELLKKAESKVNELKSKVDSANMTAQNLEKEAELAREEAIKAKNYEKAL